MLIVVMAILLILAVSRIWAAIMLRHQTNAAAVPLVNTITAKCAPSIERIILPGSVMAWHEAPIYARTNGYIKQWYVDIGYSVKKDDLLAEIETPELDAQLRQAEADLKVVTAQQGLAAITAIRWKGLLKTDSVSKQETDEKIYQAEALSASVVASRANYERLRELVGFQRVLAPFDGIISARGTDIGALINAGSNPEAKPLFRIVQSNPLRLYVNIPETYSSRIKPDMAVDLKFAEHPEQVFKATLLKTAKAIDPVTRTLLAEFVVHNQKGVLLPGSYATVQFSISTSSNNVLLPVNALIFRAEGLQVAILDKNNRVILKNISIAVDYGTHVELKTGVKPGEQIIVNPSDSISAGELVRIAGVGDKKLVS